MLIELYGGPHDGEILTRSSRPSPFVWVDRRLHLCPEPGEGRTLYRFVASREGVAGGVVLTYALTLQRVRCEGCGWFVPRDSGCVLCGKPLPARV